MGRPGSNRVFFLSLPKGITGRSDHVIRTHCPFANPSMLPTTHDGGKTKVGNGPTSQLSVFWKKSSNQIELESANI